MDTSDFSNDHEPQSRMNSDGRSMTEERCHGKRHHNEKRHKNYGIYEQQPIMESESLEESSEKLNQEQTRILRAIHHRTNWKIWCWIDCEEMSHFGLCNESNSRTFESQNQAYLWCIEMSRSFFHKIQLWNNRWRINHSRIQHIRIYIRDHRHIDKTRENQGCWNSNQPKIWTILMFLELIKSQYRYEGI